MNRSLLIILSAVLWLLATGSAVAETAATKPRTHPAYPPGCVGEGAWLWVRWSVAEWQPTMSGFIVERAVANSDGTWGPYKLKTSQGVRPGLTTYLADRSSCDDALVRLLNGELLPAPREFLFSCYRAQPSLPMVWPHWNDLEVLKLHGFAYFDWDVAVGQQYRYRVSATMRNGDPQVLWEGEYSMPTMPRPEIHDFRAEVDGEQVVLTWSIGPEHDPLAFAVKRNSQLSGRTPVVRPYRSDGTGHWYRYVDTDQSHGTLVYRLAVDHWADEFHDAALPERAVIWAKALRVPRIADLRADWRTGGLELQWQPIDQEGRLSLEIQIEGSDDWQMMPDIPLIEIARSSHLVTAALPDRPGTRFRFRPMLWSLNGERMQRGEPLPWLTVPRPMKVPTIASVEPDRMEQGTAGHRIKAEDLRSSAVLERRLATSKEWTAVDFTQRGRTCLVPCQDLPPGSAIFYRLRNRSGDMLGVPGDAAAATAWTLEPPAAPNILSLRQRAGAPEVQWTMDEAIPIQGFNILIDGQALADSESVDGDRRAWALTDIDLDADRSLGIQAVSRWDVPGAIAEVPLALSETTVDPMRLIPPLPNPDTTITDEAEALIEYYDENHEQIKLVRHVISIDGRTVLHGAKTVRAREGHLIMRHHYRLGRLHGLQRWYDPDDGTLLATAAYRDGRPIDHQTFQTHWPDETLSEAETAAFLVPANEP